MHALNEHGFSDLPKFLVGDDGDGRSFVIHCHYPRFIMEFTENGQATPLWIDAPIYDPNIGEPSAQSAALMQEAGNFFMEQINL